MKEWLIVLLVLLVACQPTISVESTDLSTEHGDLIIQNPDEKMNFEWVSYQGYNDYLVLPDQPGPAVIMIHEWWGLNQNIKNMAHELAEQGYLVLAVDLYDGRLADNSNDARTYATEVRNDLDSAILHMQEATNYLRNHKLSSGKVASVGWCFGGGMSMQLALHEQMDATVIYYGNLETDADKLDQINWPILGIFGAEDTSIPVESVNLFEQALTTQGIEKEIYVYDGVGHAFANPSNAGYDQVSTEDAWLKTVSFLDRHLKN